jgi:hypothetical protein
MPHRIILSIQLIYAKSTARQTKGLCKNTHSIKPKHDLDSKILDTQNNNNFSLEHKK